MSPLLVGLALTIGAPALKEKGTPASLVGEWEIEDSTVGGKPTGKSPNRWLFRADGTRAIFGPDGKELIGGNYTADAKDGTVDLDSTGGPAPGGQYLCRFKLDGDKLMLNVGWQKAPRPAGMEPGSECTLYLMRRAKAKD